MNVDVQAVSKLNSQQLSMTQYVTIMVTAAEAAQSRRHLSWMWRR